MNGDGGELAGGLLLIVIGVFVVARTVIHDASGQNLVDRLLSIAGGGNSSGAAAPSAAQSVTAHARFGPGSTTTLPKKLKAPTSPGNVITDVGVGAQAILHGIAPVVPSP